MRIIPFIGRMHGYDNISWEKFCNLICSIIMRYNIKKYVKNALCRKVERVWKQGTTNAYGPRQRWKKKAGGYCISPWMYSWFFFAWSWLWLEVPIGRISSSPGNRQERFPYTLITEKTISKEGLSHCNSRLYPVNTVFVTARGTVGKVGMSGVPMAMNQSCYALVGKETHQLLVYFYTLKAVDRLKHKASGAVFDAITTRDFESEQIMKLSDDDATAFLRVAEPMFQEVLNNNIENLRLSTLRDSLLPKLMSGEIDVSTVQL